MDDEDVLEDLFEEDEMLLDSQESLTAAAANLEWDDSSDDMLDDLPSTPATSQDSQDAPQNDDVKTDVGRPAKSVTVSHQPQTVLAQIEDIFDRITQTLAERKDVLTVRLKTRPTPDALRQGGLRTIAAKPRAISFPGKTATEAWRFSIEILLVTFNLSLTDV